MLFSSKSLLRFSVAWLSLQAAAATFIPFDNTTALLHSLHRRGELRDRIGAEIKLVVMPLGASITFGTASSDGNGYRATLRDTIVNDGTPSSMVDFVGSQRGGTMQDNENEGHPGDRVEQVTGWAKQFVPQFHPNLVLINAGTSDATQNFQLDTIKDRMRALLEFLYANMEPGPVILSTLLWNRDHPDRVDAINAKYRELAAEQQAMKRPLVLVDMHGPDGPQPDEILDGTHPNDAGYRKMAAIWWRGILEAASKGFFVLPPQ